MFPRSMSMFRRWSQCSSPVQLSSQRAKERNPARKFSTLIKHMVVELDRDTALYPEGNIVEVRLRSAEGR